MTDWYELPTNYSNGSSVTGVGKLIDYANYVSQEWLGAGLIFAIFFISLAINTAFGVKRTMAASSFITFIFSIYLLRVGMIHPVIPITLIVLTIIGLLGSSNQTSL